MDRKTLIISGILIIILAAIILVYFLILKPSATAINNEVVQKDVVENDFFYAKLPEGWIEVEPVYGSTVTIVKNEEQINDINAQKLNFKSYYSILHDVIDNKTEQEYLEELKNSLRENFTGITISDEPLKELNDAKTYIIKSGFNEQNIDFAVLLAINIRNQDVWIMSFNTLNEKWEEYEDTFYQVIDSFKRKK